tara:strand:- start:668 stop:856 length:189 start_codon:yes stop_codon:yes gene_type:complete
MIIKINYNKSTGNITVNSDVPECEISINDNATEDNEQELNTEISLNTSYLAEIQTTVDGGIN